MMNPSNSNHSAMVSLSQPGGVVVDRPSCKGVLFVLVGPAGVGKNTIMGQLLAGLSQLSQLPTVTTRSPRITEQHGREHFFVTPDVFEDMITNNALIEHQEVYPGKFYGTPRGPMQEALDIGRTLVADIDVVGAGALKETFKERVVLIYIAPPSVDDLEKRLRTRGQMSEDEIAGRLERASFELQFANRCDYRVVNDTLERASAEVIDVVRGELQSRNCA